MNHKDNDLVLLGEVLCTYEEYIPSDWTYVEDGNIKASITGRIKIDNEEKTISISSINAPSSIKIDDYVIGHITEVKQNKALVTIKMIKDNPREIVTGYKGFIHISKANENFVSSLHELFKIGDIVEAKVVNIYGLEYIDLSTSEKETGVIKAMCVNCRKFMKMDDMTHKLICECGKVDSRNISSNYGGF
ncbi:MAG: RNA-binding protein [Methanosphaera stadtmanae]|nr:RNA-binding protein [Methanosphaera stadtmanae]